MDELVTIIAGSRGVTDYNDVMQATLDASWTISEVVSGHAGGVDKLGERWARDFKRPLNVFPAKWDTHGKSAGYKRNVEMAENAEALIAVWDGESKGTKHMIDIAKDKGLRVYIHICQK